MGTFTLAPSGSLEGFAAVLGLVLGVPLLIFQVGVIVSDVRGIWHDYKVRKDANGERILREAREYAARLPTFGDDTQ